MSRTLNSSNLHFSRRPMGNISTWSYEEKGAATCMNKITRSLQKRSWFTLRKEQSRAESSLHYSDEDGNRIWTFEANFYHRRVTWILKMVNCAECRMGPMHFFGCAGCGRVFFGGEPELQALAWCSRAYKNQILWSVIHKSFSSLWLLLMMKSKIPCVVYTTIYTFRNCKVEYWGYINAS